MKIVGIGTRVINYVVDTLVIFLISYISYRARMFYVFYYHVTGWPFYYFFWAITMAYYLLFELIFCRTPGKWLSLSKVVSMNGKRPAVWQILVRTLLRLALVIDFVFIPFTERTLHDYASNTAVIEA
jgi:uncharacterized RDD family membrane protein YckC